MMLSFSFPTLRTSFHSFCIWKSFSFHWSGRALPTQAGGGQSTQPDQVDYLALVGEAWLQEEENTSVDLHDGNTISL